MFLGYASELFDVNELSDSQITGYYGPPKAFKCYKCGNSYVRKHALQSHLKWECGLPPKFKCSFCVYKCKLKHHLKSHLIRMHPEVIKNLNNKS